MRPDPTAAGYAACEATTRRVARNFALGIRLLPGDRRRALSAVYWFCHQADEAADGAGPVERRRARLADVADGLERALTGAPPSPAWAALADATRRYAIPADHYRELLRGVGRDIEPSRFPDWPSVLGYCHQVAGVVGLIGLRVFGGRGPAAERDADELGLALQLTNILRDLREDARAGRWYLPDEATARYGVDPAAIAVGRPQPGLAALVGDTVERARRLYAAGPRLYPRLPRATRGCPAALAGVYRGLLERIAADPEGVLARRVRLSGPGKLARGLGAAAASMWR